jgi:hypothetical protein
MFEDFRSIITCKICFRLLYQPFTVACGHTYCYTCLGEWFGRNEDRRKTCPDCRTVVRQPPAPAYTVRDITQKYIQQPGVLPEGETTEEHERMQAEESALVEEDRGNGGLFRGIFSAPHTYGGPPPPIRDDEDGVERCPYCTWELEEGAGPICPRCGHEHDEDYDSVDNMPPWLHGHDQTDEEVDDDDMYDDEREAALHPGHPDFDAHDGFETGGEAYYVSSDQGDNEDLQEVPRRPRLQVRYREPPRRPIGRRIFEIDPDHAQFSEMESEGEGEELYLGDHMPIRRRRASTPRWDGEHEVPHFGSVTPHYDTRTGRLIPVPHRMIESDEDEEDSDTEGSLQDFLVDEDEEDGIVSESDDDSSNLSNDGGQSITLSLGGDASATDSQSASSSEEDERDSRPGPDFPSHVSHAAALARARARMRRVEDSESETEVESSSDGGEDGQVQHTMDADVDVAAETEEEDEDEMPVRRRHRR